MNGGVVERERPEEADAQSGASRYEEEEPSTVSEQSGAGEEPTEGEREATADEERVEMPPASFISLIVSLATSAVAHLGFLPDPISGETSRRLELARHEIDLLGILKEKTSGNLEKDEERLLEELLSDLRMRYVRVYEEQGLSPGGESGGSG